MKLGQISLDHKLQQPPRTPGAARTGSSSSAWARSGYVPWDTLGHTGARGPSQRGCLCGVPKNGGGLSRALLPQKGAAWGTCGGCTPHSGHELSSERDRSSAGSQSHELWWDGSWGDNPQGAARGGSHRSSRGGETMPRCPSKQDSGRSGCWQPPQPSTSPSVPSCPHVPDGDLALGGRAESSRVAQGEKEDTQSLHRPGTATGSPGPAPSPSPGAKPRLGAARVGCWGAASGERGGDSWDGES